MQREDRANLKTDADRGPAPLFMDFEDNGLLTPLFGEHDRNLALIEKRLEVSITPRGNRLSIEGSSWSQQVAQAVLTDLYARLQQGLDTGSGEVDGAIRMAEATVGRSAEAAEAAAMAEDVIIRTRRRVITPRSPEIGRASCRERV